MKTLASTKQFTLRYVPKHVIPPVAARYLGSPVHPIRPKIFHMYATRDRNTLWWRVSVKPIQGFRRVVRSWCARRARLAFRQALKDRGFDAEGRRMRSESSGEGGSTPERNDDYIHGSLEIVVQPQSVQEDMTVVQTDMHHLVDVLIEKTKAPLKNDDNQKNNNPRKKKTKE
ncbi:hypothetical protein FE257_001262 [Aspergillus nanangensis]|uniref:Uncharacterized protein n=1 Tax=Aspergillus nanangensis TaxID=2582783 RepID=A0AAD4GPS2_ASPNN|nr:hypothetical protein FE257_001262 [Aspergillus nanangensis]